MLSNPFVLMYPRFLNENVLRPVAGIVFTVSLLTLIVPAISYLMIFLFIDFLIRYINPKYSLLAQTIRIISTRILRQEPRPYYSAPKRFAILIGIIFSGIISLSIVLQVGLVTTIFTSFLLIASFLQGFFGYCLGCEIYSLLIKFGMIQNSLELSATKYSS